MEKISATTRDVILLLLTTIVPVDQVPRDPARINVQTRTITSREQHLREIITLTTIITAAVEVTMPEVQVTEAPAAEVALLQDQALARVQQVQVEEINIYIHSN
tara:strand:- start:985 stop:1296 length:312 start_codon:yes stop_codon:yes gene_type:complete